MIRNACKTVSKECEGAFPADDTAALGVPIGAPATTMVMGDLDGDNRPDLIVPVESASTVRLFLTTDGQVVVPRSVSTCIGPHAVALSDIDCDGKLDLAVVCTTAMKTKVPFLLQQPDRSFVEGYSVDLRYGISYLTNDSR